MKNISLRGYTCKSNKSKRKYGETINTRLKTVAKSGWHRWGLKSGRKTKECVNCMGTSDKGAGFSDAYYRLILFGHIKYH